MSEMDIFQKMLVSEMNIFQKMLAVQSELGTVAKNLDVLDYKAVSERDIIDAVKPLEQKYGIYSYPVGRSVVDAGTMEFATKNGGTRTQLYMRIQTTYRFVNVEKPDEYVEVDTYGDGLDSADKSVGKAMTYADKYALMKAYKISTGDDPDATNSKEYGDLQSRAPKAVKTAPKESSDVKMASAAQIKYIRDLYSAEEIDTMCKRLSVSGLESVTMEQAKKMLDARAEPKK